MKCDFLLPRILSVFNLLKQVGFVVLLVGANNFAQGQWTEPVPMEPNFGTAMTAVWISNDGLRLYLSAGLAAIGWTERDSIGGEWSQWTALPPHINASNTQTSMCESPSGDTLYFTSNSDERPDGGYGWMDIYYCVRTDTGWGPAVNAGPNVNDTGREWSVNISRDGSMLLVAGQMPGASSHNIYYCQLQTDGTWGPKISFGTNINTAREEEHPSLSPDNHALYYYKVGPNGGDIWYSELVDSVWSEGLQLPSPVNSGHTEMNPCIANDGRTLWYRKGALQSGYRIVTSVDTTVLSIGTPILHESSFQLIPIPNPFNSTLSISLDVPLHQDVTLSLYDLLGREVDVVYRGRLASSTIFYVVPAALSSGVYFLRASAGERSVLRKVVLLK